MTSSYLEKFRSGMRAVQSQQILRLLNQEKDRGSITTVKEFKDRMLELMIQLQGQTLVPTLQVFLSETSALIDSESFNFMMERIQDDLTAAYSEMNDIDEVLAAHENIINNVVLANLELAVNDLEAQITSYEFLNKNQDGFDSAIFNTFRTTQSGLTQNSQVIFTDPKTSVISSTSSVQALLDTVGEKIVLNAGVESEVTPASVRQIFDFEAIASELNVEFEDSNINNMIDRTNGTSWAQSTLLSEPKDEAGVLTKLEIDLGGVKSINFIQVEPLSLYPVDIVGISIVDPNNQVVAVLSDPVEIKSNNKFLFNTLSAKRIILKVRNKNYSLTQFVEKSSSPIPQLSGDLSGIDASIQSISGDLEELIASPTAISALGVAPFEGAEQSYYEYLVGFDNIRVGLSTFTDVSIYVSKTTKVTELGQLAVKVNEKRPIGAIDSGSVSYTASTYPSGFTDYFHGALEYYVVKRDFSAADALLNSVTLPVLPLGVTGIRHEALILTERSSPTGSTPDVGYLQFFAIDDPANIHVYRNGVELPSADLDGSETDGWLAEAALVQDTPDQPLPMRYAVRIQNPNPNNIYTVSYSPALSTTNIVPTEPNLAPYLASTGLRLVDLVGNMGAWLGKDNIVYFKDIQSGLSVAYSTVNLVVVLRRNSANVNLSPVLEDYLLTTGSKNPSKFGG